MKFQQTLQVVGETNCMWFSYPTTIPVVHQVIMLKFMSQSQFMLWNQEHQDTVHQTVLVEQMKAIVNHMINVFLVHFAYLKAVLLVLALPIQQAVVKVGTTLMLVVAMLMSTMVCFSHPTTQMSTRTT